MRISLIAAMDRNRVIGRNNDLPWHLPADLLWFKKNTLGKPILMGRKTFVSIGRPLPGRTNIVLTRDMTFQAEGCIVVHDIEEALRAASRDISDTDDGEVVVIGGGQLFELLIDLADRLYLTRIDADFEGDTFFPAIESNEWSVLWQEQLLKSEGSLFDIRFMILERAAPPVGID
jgi:dihydrofolate reductase